MAESLTVVLPSLGDDDDAVVKGVVSMWLAAIGQQLLEGDDLLEITTDKAAFIVPVPKSGQLAQQCVVEGETIHVGQTIAVLTVG